MARTKAAAKIVDDATRAGTAADATVARTAATRGSRAGASRRPAPQATVVERMQAAVGGHRREIAWVGLFTASAFTLVALYGFHADDPTWVRPDVSGTLPVLNPCGPLGANIADLLFRALGVGAWSLVGGLVLPVVALARRPLPRLGSWVLGGFVLAVVLGVAELAWPVSGEHTTGGAVGAAVAGALVDVVGAVGAWIVLLAALVAGVSVLSGVSLGELAHRVMAALERAWPPVRDAARSGGASLARVVATTSWLVVVHVGRAVVAVARAVAAVLVAAGKAAVAALIALGRAIMAMTAAVASGAWKVVRRMAWAVRHGVTPFSAAHDDDYYDVTGMTPLPEAPRARPARRDWPALAADPGDETLVATSPPPLLGTEAGVFAPGGGDVPGVDGLLDMFPDVDARDAETPAADTGATVIRHRPAGDATVLRQRPPEPAVPRFGRGAVEDATVLRGRPPEIPQPAAPASRGALSGSPTLTPEPARSAPVVAPSRPQAQTPAPNPAPTAAPPAFARRAAAQPPSAPAAPPSPAPPVSAPAMVTLHALVEEITDEPDTDEAVPAFSAPAAPSGPRPAADVRVGPSADNPVGAPVGAPAGPLVGASVGPAVEAAAEAAAIAVEKAEGLDVVVKDDGSAVAPRRTMFFELPPLSLLNETPRQQAVVDEDDLRELAKTVEESLASFKVTGTVTNVRVGPVVTTFEFVPDSGISVRKVAGLQDDLAMALCALSVRVVAPIPGKGAVGIEIPSTHRLTIYLREQLASPEFRDFKGALPMVLGKDVEGRPMVADLAKMPHLLIGGTTGSGKSVGVNAMLMSLLFRHTPDELRLLLVDPKKLEFEIYADIPHLLHPVVKEADEAARALAWCCREMDRRYELLARWGTRNIANFNRKVERESRNWTREKARQYAPVGWSEGDGELPGPELLPYIVIVIDELADLMMTAKKEVQESIVRIAQMARACGMHLIIATQRPSVDVVTGLIKSNLPTRISYKLRSVVDSRTILDAGGADKLLGMGDALYLPNAGEIRRIHAPFVDDPEVEAVNDFLRGQREPQYVEGLADDPESAALSDDFDAEESDELYDKAVEVVLREGKASTSMVQRHLKIGYNRAARLIDAMEAARLIGPADGAKPREVLVGRG